MLVRRRKMRVVRLGQVSELNRKDEFNLIESKSKSKVQNHIFIAIIKRINLNLELQPIGLMKIMCADLNINPTCYQVHI